MVFYLVLTILYLFFAFIDTKFNIKFFKNEKTNKIFKIIILLFPLFLTVALRSESVGNDTSMYKHLYEKYGSLGFSKSIIQTTKEYGYILFCIFFNKLNFNYPSFQFVVALITYYQFGRLLYKHSTNVPLSIFVFICTLGYFRTMNISREMLAVMIAINSIDYLQDNNKTKFIIRVLLASMIHRSALIMLALLLYRKILSLGAFKKIIAILLIVTSYFSVDIFLKFASNFFGRYEYLIDSKYTNNNGFLAMGALLLFTLLFLYIENVPNNNMLEKPNKSLDNRNIIIKFSYYLCLLFSIIGLRFGLADRVVIYFSTFFTESICKSKNSYIIVKLSIIIGLLVYFILVMIYRNNWQGTIPYTWN